VTGDRAAIDGAVGADHVRAPARRDGVADLVGPVELVDDRVGRQRRRAEAAECRQRRGLPGSQAAGQADERHPERRGVVARTTDGRAGGAAVVEIVL